MAGTDKVSTNVKLTKEQEKEDYRVELSGGNVQVWHHQNQIALLLPSPDIERRVYEVIDRKRRELKELEEKTGWKPSP